MNFDIKNSCTKDLKIIQEKIKSELETRKNEKQVPLIRMLDKDVFSYFDEEAIDYNAKFIINSMKSAIKEKNKLFHMVIVMTPETDYLDMKRNDLM